MAKRVSGWLARDGKVYKTEHEADLIDTTAGLMEACERENIAPRKFLAAVDLLHEEILDYLSLRYTPNSERTSQETSEGASSSTTRPAPVDPADDGTGEGGTNALLDEPPSSTEPVPDLWDSSQSSDIREEQPRLALRSGLYYARSVQRHAAMAVGNLAGITKARSP